MQNLEWLTPFLAIVGTVTGIAGLLLHLVKFRREKPNLQVETHGCFFEHEGPGPYNPDTEEGSIAVIDCLVHNRGDRGTQINAIETRFHVEGVEYQKVEAHSVFVEAHKSERVRHDFFFPGLRIEKDVRCRFALHHTHGKKTFDADAPYTSFLNPRTLASQAMDRYKRRVRIGAKSDR